MIDSNAMIRLSGVPSKRHGNIGRPSISLRLLSTVLLGVGSYVLAGAFSASTVSAEAGNCQTAGNICVSKTGYSGQVAGDPFDTYRFASSDRSFYSSGSSNGNYYNNQVSDPVDDHVIVVRNRITFSRACGYRDGAFAPSNNAGPLLWNVNSAANGFVGVTDSGASSLFVKKGSGAIPSNCGSIWGT
jgi:hypothetical protein